MKPPRSVRIPSWTLAEKNRVEYLEFVGSKTIDSTTRAGRRKKRSPRHGARILLEYCGVASSTFGNPGLGSSRAIISVCKRVSYLFGVPFEERTFKWNCREFKKKPRGDAYSLGRFGPLRCRPPRLSLLRAAGLRGDPAAPAIESIGSIQD